MVYRKISLIETSLPTLFELEVGTNLKCNLKLCRRTVNANKVFNTYV